MSVTISDEEYQTIKEQANRVPELETRVAEQEERADRAEAERDELRDRLDEVETKQAGFGAAISSNQNRIEELEAGSGHENPTFEAGETGSTALNTVENDGSPLAQITNIPEFMADEQLHKNQERARFIAKDIKQYGDMRLGEYVISSGDIRKVLAAKEGGPVHWQTVKRVIEFLDGMGKEDTTVKDRHGRIVCFDPEAVEQYGRTAHGVVSPETGTV